MMLPARSLNLVIGRSGSGKCAWYTYFNVLSISSSIGNAYILLVLAPFGAPYHEHWVVCFWHLQLLFCLPVTTMTHTCSKEDFCMHNGPASVISKHPTTIQVSLLRLLT